MVLEKGQHLNKELSCYQCGRLTNIRDLKAYPSGGWICSECSARLFGSKKIRTGFQEPEQNKKVRIVKEFDPFEEEHEIKNTAEVIPKVEKTKFSIKAESMQLPKKSRPNKQLYKCTYCTFESRHYMDDDICPNCGRKRLAKVISTNELLKNMEKEPFFE